MFTLSESKNVIEVRMEDSRTLIESAPVPMGDALAHRLEAVIDGEARDIKAATISKARADDRNARAESERANKLLAEEEARLEQKEAERAGLEGGSRLLAGLFSLCAGVCLSAEFTLTLVTLPFILGIRQWSYLGVTLALAPTTAVIILDKVFGRLIEEPWRAFRRTPGRSFRRMAAITVMALFMTGLGIGNVYTVIALAGAREHATDLRHALESGNDDLLTPEKLAVHRTAINAAVLAVSVFVTLDGACFSLLGLSEFRALRTAKAADRLIAALRAGRSAAGEAAAKAGTVLAAAAARAESAEALGVVEGDRYRAERLYRLDLARSRSAPRPSSEEQVRSILVGSERMRNLQARVA